MSWNYGNISYALCNICGLNLIEIGCIWIFMGVFCPLLPPFPWPDLNENRVISFPGKCYIRSICLFLSKYLQFYFYSEQTDKLWVLYIRCIKYGINLIEIGPIWIFRGGRGFCLSLRPLITGERSWNSGNLPCLVCNTYDLHFYQNWTYLNFHGGLLPHFCAPKGVENLEISLT